MTEAICREIEQQQHYLNGDTVETIYFGGGTPSVLSKSEVMQLLETVWRCFEKKQVAEVTFEANPEDLTPEMLDFYRQVGINRLSIGIQSFYEPHLKFMNRLHSAQHALECVRMARKSGIDNVSIDLIYAVPFKDHSIWKDDLAMAMELHPEHISAYCLTIEEKTAFGRWQKAGKLPPIDDQFAAEQFEMLVEVLEKGGYEQYEISNFARDRRYSKHNTSYWQQKKYLGVGPGAHSYNGISRQSNLANNEMYIESVAKGKVPFTMDHLGWDDRVNEYLLTTLRTKWGTDLGYLKGTLGADLLIKKENELRQLQNQALLFVDDSTLYLTKKGKLFADEVTSQLMV